MDAAVAELNAAADFQLYRTPELSTITLRWGGIGQSSVAGQTTTTRVGSEILGADIVVEPGLGPDERLVVLHELAHAVGAGHSDDPTAVMFPSVNPAQTGHLSSGDRAVLEVLADLAGCVT